MWKNAHSYSTYSVVYSTTNSIEYYCGVFCFNAISCNEKKKCTMLEIYCVIELSNRMAFQCKLNTLTMNRIKARRNKKKKKLNKNYIQM